MSIRNFRIKEIKYMNNVKVVREVKKPRIYVGMEVLLTEAGTLVRVLGEGVSHNDILMRTDSRTEPLLGLKLWISYLTFALSNILLLYLHLNFNPLGHE